MELEQTIKNGYIHLETNIRKDEWYDYLTNGYREIPLKPS